MFNLFEEVKLAIDTALCELYSLNKSNCSGIKVEIAPTSVGASFDLFTNAAMVLARHVKALPMEVAQKIIEKLLQNKSIFANVEVASPGFINIQLASQYLEEALSKIVEDQEFGFTNFGNGEPINVEYVSANPTGPLHVGHARGAIFGDVIASLLSKCGYKVTKEYYINDAGAQIETLLKSTLCRYKNLPIPEGCYSGEYLIPVANKLRLQYGNKLEEMEEKEATLLIKPFVLDEMMSLIKATLHRMNITHDVFSSEEEIIKYGNIEESIEILRRKGFVYSGTLSPPKGKKKENWEARPQELFKSTSFGDDEDRPLIRQDGSFAYFAPDIGYHWNKIKRGFNKMVLVLGADHKGYVKRIKAAVNVLSAGKTTIDVELCELVHFIKNDIKQRSSKRSGNFLLVDQILDEIDVGALRFIILTRKSDTVMSFDLEKIKEQSKDNPVFYTQYAYSRCCSLERKFAQLFGQPNKFNKLSNINYEDDKRRMFLLLNFFPEIIKVAVKTTQPHIVISYAIEIASSFHSLWTNGSVFIKEEDREYSEKMLVLVKIVKSILTQCFNVLKITPLERM